MEIFFMSHWDDACRVTKFYICHGEQRLGGYHIDTLPLFVLTDDVAQSREVQNIIGALWEPCNIFPTPLGRPEGDQYFHPSLDVFRLLGSMKQFIGNHRAARTAGVAVLPAPGEWGSMSEAAGNASEAMNDWMDAASALADDGRLSEGLVLRDPNRQPTLRVPGDVAFRTVAGGGGGTMIHSEFGVPSSDLSIQVVEREVNMGQQARRRVRVTTADGRVHRMSLREYERRINTGRLVSLNGV